MALDAFEQLVWPNFIDGVRHICRVDRINETHLEVLSFDVVADVRRIDLEETDLLRLAFLRLQVAGAVARTERDA